MDNFYLVILLAVIAFISGTEPFNISIFTALLAGSRGRQHSNSQMSAVALSFFTSLALVIWIFGFSLLSLFNFIDAYYMQFMVLALAVVTILWGLVRLKSFYWYRPFVLAPYLMEQIIHTRTIKKNNSKSSFLLGIYASVGNFLNIFFVVSSLIAIIYLLSPETDYFIWLIGLFFVAPFVIILSMVLRGTKISALIRWKQDTKGTIDLSIGLVCIAMGWLMFLIMGGIIQ